jgi:hypothetical protein
LPFLHTQGRHIGINLSHSLSNVNRQSRGSTNQ